MKKWVWVILFISSSGQADWLQVNDLSIDYTQFFAKGRAPLVTQNGLPDRELGQRVGISLELGVGPVYWGNRVEGYTDRDTQSGGGQFRSTGWQFEVGARVIPQLDIYYTHHSQHVLDHAYSPGYPVEDGVGIRLKVVGGKK